MPITLPPISRRGFIKGSLAAAAALAIGARPLLADAAADQSEHLVLLSDIHISVNRANVQHRINMWKNLGQVSDEILALKHKPLAVLINGDCAFNHGLPEDYQTVLEGLRPMREAGLPIHVALGNHDSREHLLSAMGADDDAVKAVAGRRVSVQPFKHADWYMLDSLNITAKTPGLLGPEQIAWLKTSLEAKPDRPAVVILHHQPQVQCRIPDRSRKRAEGAVVEVGDFRVEQPFGHDAIVSHNRDTPKRIRGDDGL